jgi:hypothetical protein
MTSFAPRRPIHLSLLTLAAVAVRRGDRDAAGAPPLATLLAVSAVFVVSSLALYVAGLVLLAWEGRRDLAILLAAVGGVALSIATLP